MCRKRVVVVVAAMMIAAGLARADAASLGGLNGRSLDAFSVVGPTGAPTVLTWENFTGANGTNLSGTALDGGGSWSVDAGTWTIGTNRARVTNTAAANMWVATGNANVTAVVTLTIGASAQAGLSVRGDASRRIYAIYTKASGGTVELYKISGGSTLLGSATGVGTPASAVMHLDATTDTIRVRFAGTEVVSYTLTGGEVGQFAGLDRVGLYASNDTVTRWDDFHVDA